jgi:hypothetical protein
MCKLLRDDQHYARKKRQKLVHEKHESHENRPLWVAAYTFD